MVVSKGIGSNMAIYLDGKFDEPIWKNAQVHTDFFSLATHKESEISTKVQITNDENYIYFGVICEEPFMSNLKNSVRENILKVYGDDSIEIMLDVDGDGIDFHHFLVNVSGYRGQEFRKEKGNVAIIWENGNWFAEGHRDQDKWTVEIAIPFAILNNEKSISETIAFNVARNRRTVSPREEMSLGEKGEFLVPEAFRKIRLKNFDPEVFQCRVSNPRLEKIFEKQGITSSAISCDITNPTNKNRVFDVSAVIISPSGDSWLKSSNISVKAKTQETVTFSYQVSQQGTHKFVITLSEGERMVFSSIQKVNLEFVPITIDIYQPFYRNTIYSDQNLDQIKTKVKLNLSEQEFTGSVLTVTLQDQNGQIIAIKKLTEVSFINNVAMSVPDLPTGRYMISAQLEKSNQQIGFTEETILKLPPPAAGNQVYIDKNCNLIVNGKPTLPIVWWGVPPYEKIAKTGADGIIVVVSKQNMVPVLEELQKYGLMAVIAPWTGSLQEKYWLNQTTLSQEAKDSLRDIITTIKNHPALLCYYLVDEPEGKAYNPDIIMETYQFIKDIDPYHPMIICNESVLGLQTYSKCADMLVPDPYPAPIKKGGLKRGATYISLFLTEATIAGGKKKLIGLTPEVFNAGDLPNSINPDRRETSFVEQRCIQFLGIVHSAKFFNYYTFNSNYGAPRYPDLRIGIPYIIKEIKVLAPSILEGVELVGKSSDSCIHMLVKEYHGNLYIISVNVEKKLISATLTLPKEVKQLKVISENRILDVCDRSFTENFIPYGVHIYTTDIIFPDLTPLDEIAQQIRKEGGMFSLNY